MAEYIYTNLPQYVRTNSRTEFSSSVVSSGAVLLFSENGSSLTAKLPDGSFVDVGGSGGTDVSSTTAEAGDVLSGKIFYTSGGVMTSGTIPTVSASLSANVTTVPSGYIAASQTLIVPLASSATVAGGIVTIPAGYVASDYTVSAGGGSATDFFKCATVTSGGSSWTGYKAVLSGGSYSFESAVTSGLSYGGGFLPEVDKIYTDGALVRANLYLGNLIPQNGLVFYAPLSQSAATAQTGQALTGSPASFTTYLDVPCARFDGSQYMESEMTNIPYSESPFSISMWINLASNTSGDRGLLGIGTAEDGGLIAIISKSSGITLSGHGGGYGWDNAGPAAFTFNGEWHHLVIVFAQGNAGSRTASMYMDGSLLKSASFVYNPEVYSWGGTHFYIGSYWGGAWLQNCPCFMSALRLYNRELTSDEITALGTEFTPGIP